MKRSGFTLLELLIVVAIIAILIALALPFYQDYITKSKLTASASDLNTFKQALQKYDQLESTPFVGIDMRTLIGKYLQDFRQNDPNQERPRDPWNVSYYVNATYGVLLAAGPNNFLDSSGSTDLAARTAKKDDIMVTWKPPFFVSGAKAIASNCIELELTRPASDTTVAAADFTLSTGQTVASVQQTAPTLIRLYIDTSAGAFLAGGTACTVTVDEIEAKDTRKMGAAAGDYDLRPDGTKGNEITFTPQANW